MNETTHPTPSAVQRHIEAQYRIGASHAVNWINNEIKSLLEAKCYEGGIAERIGHLNQVILDWRESHCRAGAEETMPAGNPWDWNPKELDAYIADHKGGW